MASVCNVFRRMRKNRRLYIGEAGILALHPIATGYGECLRDFGMADEEFERFVSFVHDALKAERSGFSIWQLLAQRTTTDEEAFERFFSLLQEFDECQKSETEDSRCLKS